MATSELTLALIGTGGVVIGALVGGFSSWSTAAIISGRAQKDAQRTLRREGYASFIVSIDRLERFWRAQASSDNMEAAQVEPLLDQMVTEIQKAYVIVLLAGSKTARDAAQAAWHAAWATYDFSDAPEAPDITTEMATRINSFRTASYAFVQIAQNELSLK